MKKIYTQTFALASLALVSGLASAQINTTPHNLTTTGSGQVNTQTNTQQICVFCHTPHASNTGVSAPLWNKGTPSTTYTTYSTANSSTIDGQVLAVGSVSAACLSCHDGSQAMDNLVNAPGTGGLNASGSKRGYAWTGPASGTGLVSGIANLSGDLTNDHPIGIEYCGGGLSGTGTTVSGTCKDLDFKNSGSTNGVKTKSINSQQVFWVDSGSVADNRDKGDIILFTRTFSAGARPSVECASCHDPHKAKGSDDVNFMRVATAGSAICLACHTK